MNENLQNALADVIVSTTGTLEQSKNFILEQAPEVVQQLITWTIVHGLATFIIGIFVLALNPTYHWILYKTKVSEKDWGPASHIAGGAIVLLLTCSITGSLLSLDWLKAWIAPKLFLIEYAAELVK